MTPRSATLLIGLALAATWAAPARAQDHAVLVGVNVPAGVLGAEYLRHPQGDRVGFAVGAGIAGIGGRVQTRVRSDRTFDGYRNRYLSAGLLVSPWVLGAEGSRGVALEATHGIEIINDVFHGSAGGGLFVPLVGEANGGILGPSLRFVIGVPF